MLRRFCLNLPGGLYEGDPCQVYKYGVLFSGLIAELSDCLQKGLALNVSNGSADLHDRDVEPGGAALDVIFDFIGNMRNNLHGLPQIFPLPFF